MKKLISSFLLLVLLTACSNSEIPETIETSETTTVSIETTEATTTTTYIETTTECTTESTEPTYDNWLFVGDSRFVFWSMWGFEGEYIAEVGQGLNMIYDNYDEIISYRDYNVVFALGANQWWSAEEYVDLLNSLPDEFTKNNKIIVMSVNPTDGSYEYLNEDYDDFNAIVRDWIREDYQYVDSATYMKDNGFSTSDGLHYTRIQDEIIYDFLMSEINS